MRVNIYAEEMTERIEIVEKEIDGQTFTGIRFYLELPVTVGDNQFAGPFLHKPGDDDSAAVTFWGKRDLHKVLIKALSVLTVHEALAPVRNHIKKERERLTNGNPGVESK